MGCSAAAYLRRENQARVRGLLGFWTQGTPTKTCKICGSGPLPFFGGGQILCKKKSNTELERVNVRPELTFYWGTGLCPTHES